MIKLGRNDPCPCGSGKKYKLCCGSLMLAPATPLAPTISLQALFQRAVEHHQHGRLPDAEALYRNILQQQPEHADALHLLGVIALQRGHHGAAVKLIQQALKLKLSEHYYANLGNALDAQGNLDEAIACYRQALAIQPRLAEAHCNLGSALLKHGELGEAITCCRRAIAIKPDLAEAHNNLGNALKAQGQVDEALTCYQHALSLMPDFAEVHRNMGQALRAQGKLDSAIASYLTALRLQESDENKQAFMHCIRDAHFNAPHPEIRQILIRALAHVWVKAGELLTPVKSLIEQNQRVQAAMARANEAWPARLSKPALFGKDDLDLIADDLLLQCLLENVAINSIALERLLTMTRRVLLDEAVMLADSGSSIDQSWQQFGHFYSTLARQCFINEYVYACTDAELQQVALLSERVSACLAAKARVHPLWLIALATYAPLSTLPCAEALASLTWPDAVSALLRQQIIEPGIERSLRATIPRLTPVDDAVSRLVQAQYEENPYPRWVHLPTMTKSVSVDTLMRRQFPESPFQPLGKDDAVDILIAGCGTGQHPIQTAQQFTGANILAVDLSLSSLCYAKRKTDELAMSNIAYAQADIMNLGVIGKTFDLIESSGVLHHLADPVAGWQVLLNVLRPGGLMCIGLYSEIARQDIVSARDYIAEQGYAANAKDIRRCRQALMADDKVAQFTQFLSSRDFYAMSDCRDLLFHVQEQRFTLPQLQAMIENSGVSFLGFMVDAEVAQQYTAQFPDDPGRTNFDHWHQFETAHPNTFAHMYQFWVQKPK